MKKFQKVKGTFEREREREREMKRKMYEETKNHD